MQDDKNQFEPHLLPEEAKNTKDVGIHFLNIWHLKISDNKQLADLLKTCLETYEAKGFINKEDFAKALKE